MRKLNKKHIFALLVGPFFALSVFANTNFPSGCKPVNFKFVQQQLILNTTKNASKQRLFLLNNISNQDFWLDHTVAHRSASAGWSSQLTAGHWTALALQKSQFILTCNKMQKGSMEQLSCPQLLQVCEVAMPRFTTADAGSYWVAEDQSLSNLLKQIHNRGINWNSAMDGFNQH